MDKENVSCVKTKEHSDFRKGEILLFAGIWKILVDIMPGKISQA
jgi:hypothetical protein